MAAAEANRFTKGNQDTQDSDDDEDGGQCSKYISDEPSTSTSLNHKKRSKKLAILRKINMRTIRTMMKRAGDV